jgi:hypothetical protein
MTGPSDPEEATSRPIRICNVHRHVKPRGERRPGIFIASLSLSQETSALTGATMRPEAQLATSLARFKDEGAPILAAIGVTEHQDLEKRPYDL